MKYGKKQFTVDENKRDTYRDSLSLCNNLHIYPNSIGNMKRLVPVGLQEALAYARSLARYAANLGPVAWKMATKKIEAVLPAGIQYGPGWVGDNEAPSRPLPFSTEKQISSNSTAGDCNSGKVVTPPTSDFSSGLAHGSSEGMVEAVRKLNSQNDVIGQGDASSWRRQFPSQQNPHHSYRNGFNGMFGYNLSAAAGQVAIPGHSMTEGVSVLSQKVAAAPGNDPSSSHSLAMNHVNSEQSKLLNTSTPGYQMAQGQASGSHAEAEMWNSGKSSQQRHTLSVPPDLNVRVPASSPTSSLQIGSPQQPDLALQL